MPQPSLPAKKLLLLSFDWTRPKDPPMSLGQASILAKLKQSDIDVTAKSWSVNDEKFNLNDALEFIMQHADANVDVAIGTYVWHEPSTQNLLNKLKLENFPGRIILGGPQISYTKQNLEQYYPQADIFIRGYAEDALTKLLSSSQKKPLINGVHYANSSDLKLSAQVDLNDLPSPYLTGIIKPQRFIRWETQRGCPFRCTFCQHRESDNSMLRRQLDYLRVMQEVEWIIANPIIQDIAVLDPTFNSGPHYLAILQKLVAGCYRGKLALQCRFEMVNETFLDVVCALNQTARVVLEFGLQTIHQNEAKIIRRLNNMDKVTQILSELKQRNIEIEISLIFGLPGQTLRSFQASVQFCKDYAVPTIYAYPLMLLRGTPLHAEKEKLQLIESSDLNININRIQSNIPHVVASPTFKYEEWCAMVDIAESLNAYNAKSKSIYSENLTVNLPRTLRLGDKNSENIFEKAQVIDNK